MLWGLVLEFPIRYWCSPDPWVQEAGHWYFVQPARSIVEMTFVLLALLPLFWWKGSKPLLGTAWSRNEHLYLWAGVLGSVLFFGLQQGEEIGTILHQDLLRHVPLWFATGMLIGIGQELTFRGLIYTGLAQGVGMRWAVALSTLCFVLAPYTACVCSTIS